MKNEYDFVLKRNTEFHNDKYWQFEVCASREVPTAGQQEPVLTMPRSILILLTGTFFTKNPSIFSLSGDEEKS